MDLGTSAARWGEKTAHVVLDPDGEPVCQHSYAQLNTASIRLARLFRQRGVKPGDAVAFILSTGSLLIESVWAAQRSGLRYTVVNPLLSATDITSILRDCGAVAVILDRSTRRLAPLIPHRWDLLLLAVDDLEPLEGAEPLEPALASQSSAPLDDEQEGADFLFTSGTSGRPKGVRSAPTGLPMGESARPLVDVMTQRYGFGPDNIYLSTAPLHHSGSLRYLILSARIGSTAVVLKGFEPLTVLRTIERYRITHLQLVPTMMIRIMKLPAQVRDQFDVSSVRFLFHSGAPCPPETKQAMIDWLGPVVHEGYAATEGLAVVTCNTQEWLAHPGTVGRPLFGAVHICGPDGTGLPAGETGTVWFSGGPPFAYVNDPEANQRARNEQGWTTVHDIGYLDGDGYLYLRGRQDGIAQIHGVPVYPLDTEHALLRHPHVLDAVVFARPDPDAGQRLHALVVPTTPSTDPDELVTDLERHCAVELSGLQRPAISVVAGLPRHHDGKLHL